VGDPPGGLNWQILCNLCNSTKQEVLSSMQLKEANNWLYGLGREEIATPTRSTSWVLFRQRPACEECGCPPTSSQLTITQSNRHLAPVVDLLNVHCRECAFKLGVEIMSFQPGTGDGAEPSL